MGLNCSHGAFDGAYSAFNRFRQFILKSIGGSYPPHSNTNLDNNRLYWETDFGNIEDYEGLCEFLNHSDCDGEISSETCKMIADELESILPRVEELAKTETSSGHIERNGGFVAVTKQFIDGCRLAHKRDEPLLFK